MSTSTPVLDRQAPPARYGGTAVPLPLKSIKVRASRAQVRQLIIGLVALPLTALPFIAYMTYTPEGRLVRDRALIAVSPPRLPTLAPETLAAIAAVSPRFDGKVMALAYHGIGSASDGEGGFVLSVKRFGEHLAALKAAGMNAVTAAQVADAFTGGAPLPPNAVMISFDDGRTDAMMFADPLLKEAGMSATMFVIAGAASKPGIYYASWDKIESYAQSGRWDIQSHTMNSHREQKADGGESLPMLTSLASEEPLEEFRTRIREDLHEATAAIEAHVGRRPVAFAYPFGAYGGDRTNDPAIADIVRQEVAGLYGVAFQQDEQETIPLLTPDHDLLRLRRVEVQDWSGVQLLERIEFARQLAEAADGTDDAADPGVVDAAPLPDAEVAEPPPPHATSTGPAAAGAASRTVAATAAAPSGAAAPATSAPPVVTTVAPVGVTTPTTVPPPPPAVTPPPTAPPSTSPPTTPPPSTTVPPTSPPTTVCKPAGKSGKCAKVD